MWPLVEAAVSGIASAFGQSQANKANVRLARERMTFEGDQVTKQMQFQERMSGSSYQRATEDMRLAGINPMLAYMQGGASTPGGGAASGAQATVQDVIGPAVASAQHARRLSAELRQIEQDTALKQHQAVLVNQQHNNAVDENRNIIASRGETEARTRLHNSSTYLNEASLAQARGAAALYSGRFGTGFSVMDRLFGGRALSPLGLRR